MYRIYKQNERFPDTDEKTKYLIRGDNFPSNATGVGWCTQLNSSKRTDLILKGLKKFWLVRKMSRFHSQHHSFILIM